MDPPLYVVLLGSAALALLGVGALVATKLGW